ncbi:MULTISPECIES: hypothetical protein [Burkholderia]|uniref:hypothetical protein n=1 Tax=Burkholderia TaxID=32008 RepID=UPI0010F8BA27|nr:MULTISPECIES: hypothetical protein [Burkholderia]MBD1412871.1 hypothetical protein [Burkholderia contaminans]UXZ68679.1 heparinase II/III-family protein [Burkholderia contaminans]
MKTAALWVLIAGACVFGVYSCANSDWYRESERAEAARRHAEETPHVIREADGCKVYAFKSGENWHFFTRCGSTVTTERSWSESCGKNCTARKSESIATDGNQ